MISFLLICAIILIACVIGSKLSRRFGVPTLLFFIALGMLFGSDGIAHFAHLGGMIFGFILMIYWKKK